MRLRMAVSPTLSKPCVRTVYGVNNWLGRVQMGMATPSRGGAAERTVPRRGGVARRDALTDRGGRSGVNVTAAVVRNAGGAAATAGTGVGAGMADADSVPTRPW